MSDLKGKTLFITGGSRGIGRSIILRAAKDGANIVLCAKTSDPHPQLEGTIHSVAKEIEELGGRALPIQMDARDEDQIAAAVAKGVETFGGVDILVNNASAIQLTDTLHTPMKRFDLMFGVNVRATFATTQACIPHLKAASNPHVLMLSPPLNMEAKWFAPHCAYTMSKYGMSMCVLGMSEELRKDGVAVNALWPRTTIATAAVNMLGGEALMKASRKPEIMADAAYWILTQDARATTGNFFVDDEVMAKAGVTDLSSYAVTPGAPLVPDFFL
ncbi:MAG: NAD(P)-dependent oxidoreductase [Proteobacteria bacterium]|nr:NAD(P)-dependent oxidoreductase [Pseudomonadota bacterium]